MFEKLERLALRFAEIDELLASPEVASDPDRSSKLGKERADLEPVVAAFRQLRSTQEELEDARALAKDDDEDLAAMAREEIPTLTEKVSFLEDQLKVTLLPKDPNDNKNAIVEVRAGTGGDEAGLFAGDLFRMYQRYSQRHGLQIELMDSNGSEQGGFKEVVFEVNGPEAYRLMKHEGGVHRVQRVPVTEAQGRIQATMSSMSDESAFESFKRMEERIEDMERQALAASELAGELEGDTLQQQFQALEYQGSADNQLLELKKKMGMLPAGDKEAPPQLSGGAADHIEDAEVVEDDEVSKDN